MTLLALGLVLLTSPTPLQSAILRRDLVMEEALLRRGVDANFAGKGEAPIILALQSGVKFVLPLLEAGANSRICDSKGTPAIMIAAESSSLCIMHALIAAGADVNAYDGDGRTALHLAAERGAVSHVSLLMSCKADVKRRDKNGKTAMDVARAKGFRDIAALLSASR